MCRFSMIVALAFIAMSCSENGKEKGRGSQRATPEVDYHVVGFSDVEVAENYAGILLPFEEVVLRPETSGRVVQLNFLEGTAVTKGQLLVKVNDDDLRAQLEKNEAQLDLAKEDEERKRALLAINGISKEEYDNAATTVKSLSADVDHIKASIAKTEIRAPFDGTVGLRQISLGAFVNNATEIGVLRQTNSLKLEFAVPEKMASIVHKGMVVSFSCAGTEPRQAEIYALESGIDLVTRTLKVRGKIDNADHRLLAGAFATVQVSAGQTGKTIMVPAQAIVPIMEGESVWLVRQGKAIVQPIKTGYRTSTHVLVNNGLAVGDTVILTGFMQLKQDQPVRARKLN
ncbi:MAG: efflux RND transporter periplasmic adaptor subunit [Breznakibacter sp.]